MLEFSCSVNCRKETFVEMRSIEIKRTRGNLIFRTEVASSLRFVEKEKYDKGS